MRCFIQKIFESKVHVLFDFVNFFVQNEAKIFCLNKCMDALKIRLRTYLKKIYNHVLFLLPKYLSIIVDYKS